MKSRTEGRNYIIQYDEEFPTKINKNKADRSLGRITNALNSLNCELQALYDDNYELYYLITSAFSSNSLDCSDGNCHRLKSLQRDISELQNFLSSHNDEIVPASELTTLSDMGYEKQFGSYDYWEKPVSDDGIVEIIEEIHIRDIPLRRLRKTEWEDDPHGRHSKSITYKKLPVGKRLMKVIENTKEKYDTKPV